MRNRWGHGYRSIRAEIPPHVLRGGGADPFSRRRRHSHDADRYLSGDQDSGGDGDLAVHRAEHTGDGAAGHHLQPVFDQRQRQRDQEYRSADHDGSVGPEDLLPTGRQSRPRIAQVVAATNAIRALMPPGIQPPIVVQFNASSVPVLQISLRSHRLHEQELYDYGIYRMRQQLAPVPGITLPTPAGGKYRQIMVDIDPAKLVAKGLTPLDVVNAVNAQSLTLPSGTAKMGDKQYTVRTNATPASID